MSQPIKEFAKLNKIYWKQNTDLRLALLLNYYKFRTGDATFNIFNTTSATSLRLNLVILKCTADLIF